MARYLAPVMGLAVFLIALFTMPAVWAQSAPPAGETTAALTMIPFVGDIILQIQKWLPVPFKSSVHLRWSPP